MHFRNKFKFIKVPLQRNDKAELKLWLTFAQFDMYSLNTAPSDGCWGLNGNHNAV